MKLILAHNLAMSVYFWLYRVRKTIIRNLKNYTCSHKFPPPRHMIENVTSDLLISMLMIFYINFEHNIFHIIDLKLIEE